MEKKFTRGMLCEEFKCKCRECPLHSDWNTYGKACWLLDEDEIQFIMSDYPYTDVKARMIFNDFETRLTAVEEKVANGVEFTFKPGRIISGDFSIGVVDQKLYDKLEAKHEADCRLISEYDLENKILKDQNAAQNDIVCDLYSKLHTEQKERVRCEAVIVDKNQQIDEWKKRCDRLRDMDKKRLFDFKNAENERDHYKGLYSSKCDDYDKLLEKQIKAEEEIANYKNLFHSLNHKHQNVVGEMKSWKERATSAEKELDYLKMKNEKPSVLRQALEIENKALRTACDTTSETLNKLKSEHYIIQENLKITKEKLKETEEKLNDARVLNKMREDVFEANIKLQKIIEAKDREIGLLRAELDKYTPYDDDDDYDID